MESTIELKVFALIIAIIFIIRIIISIILKKSAIKFSTKFYSNPIKKYLYLAFFLFGSFILLREINIYQYLIGFVTFGALYFDYFLSALVPDFIKKELISYISKVSVMWMFMLIGGLVSLAVILKYFLIF